MLSCHRNHILVSVHDFAYKWSYQKHSSHLTFMVKSNKHKAYIQKPHLFRLMQSITLTHKTHINLAPTIRHYVHFVLMMLKYLQPHDHIIILAYTFAYIYFHISYTFALNYLDSSTSNTRWALHHSSTRYKLLMHNFDQHIYSTRILVLVPSKAHSLS